MTGVSLHQPGCVSVRGQAPSAPAIGAPQDMPRWQRQARAGGQCGPLGPPRTTGRLLRERLRGSVGSDVKTDRSRPSRLQVNSQIGHDGSHQEGVRAAVQDKCPGRQAGPCPGPQPGPRPGLRLPRSGAVWTEGPQQCVMGCSHVRGLPGWPSEWTGLSSCPPGSRSGGSVW